jgi:hypothetical protein
MKLEKIFARHSSDRGFILRIYKQLKKIIKKSSITINKWGNNPTDNSQKCKWNKCIKSTKTSRYHKNANHKYFIQNKETTLRFPFTPVMTITPSSAAAVTTLLLLIMTPAGETEGQKELLHYWRECVLIQLLWKTA